MHIFIFRFDDNYFFVAQSDGANATTAAAVVVQLSELVCNKWIISILLLESWPRTGIKGKLIFLFVCCLRSVSFESDVHNTIPSRSLSLKSHLVSLFNLPFFRLQSPFPSKSFLSMISLCLKYFKPMNQTRQKFDKFIAWKIEMMKSVKLSTGRVWALVAGIA